MKARNPSTGTLDTVYVKALDSMPVGTQIEFTGDTIPTGWEEVNDYSTDEVNTGEKWIDGKPIYRKVINFGSLPNATTKQIAHGASNVENIWVDFGNSYMKNSVNDYYSVGDYDWHTYVDETYVYMYSEYDRTDSYAYITIKYTKTTD